MPNTVPFAAGDSTYSLPPVQQAQQEQAAQKEQLTNNDTDTNPQRQADNEKLCWSRLRDANRDCETIDFGSAGDATIRAGNVAQVSGYGIADGNYLIDKTIHRVSGASKGYTTNGVCHKALVGYGSSSAPQSGSATGPSSGNTNNSNTPTSASSSSTAAQSNVTSSSSGNPTPVSIESGVQSGAYTIPPGSTYNTGQGLQYGSGSFVPLPGS